MRNKGVATFPQSYNIICKWDFLAEERSLSLLCGEYDNAWFIDPIRILQTKRRAMVLETQWQKLPTS